MIQENPTYIELTKDGEAFIRRIADWLTANGEYKAQSMLKGNNGLLPFSNETDPDKVWTATVVNVLNNTPVVNNTQMANYLIDLYNKYGKQYELDANVLAAQAYKESTYKIWNYVGSSSTASGVAQILMNTMYDLIYNPNKEWLTDAERDKITKDMAFPNRKSSWINVEDEDFVSDNTIETRQMSNRSILHQNIIDNPDLSIKLQCAFMEYIGERNANLAASALFAYNTGSERESNNYVELIEKTSTLAGRERVETGSDYVQKIFGYMGDKNHKFVTGLDDITLGYSFGYEDKLNLGKEWDDYEANVKSGVKAFTSRSLSTLDESLKNAYIESKEEFEDATTYRIGLTSVFRSPERQRELYQVGRSPTGVVEGKIITTLDGTSKGVGGKGLSNHNYFKSRAFDFAVFNADGTYVRGKRGDAGRALYEDFFNLVNAKVPNTKWGGNFTSLDDAPHIALI